MGKLIKNHWARLIVLTAAIYQVAAAVEGFFWPKIFWDFLTKTLDPAVKPFPVLQIFNLLFGIIGLAWEWPLGFISGSIFHKSIEARLVAYPLFALACLLQYQTTNAGLYYLIGLGVYFWAFAEGEVSLSSHDEIIHQTNVVSRWSVLYLGHYRRSELMRSPKYDLQHQHVIQGVWPINTVRTLKSTGCSAIKHTAFASPTSTLQLASETYFSMHLNLQTSRYPTLQTFYHSTTSLTYSSLLGNERLGRNASSRGCIG